MYVCRELRFGVVWTGSKSNGHCKIEYKDYIIIAKQRDAIV